MSRRSLTIIAGAGILALASLASAAAAPRESVAAQAGPLKVAYIAENLNGWVQANINGVKRGAKVTNMPVFNANFDPVKLNGFIQDAVASKKYNALAIGPVSIVSVPAVKDAIKAGLKVATVLQPVATVSSNTVLPGQVISTNQNFLLRGVGMGRLIVAACAGIDPCKVAHLIGVKALPLEQPVLNALKAQLKGHSNIHLVAVAEGKYDPQASRVAAQDILQAHPDLNVFSTGADPMTTGVELAVNSAGLGGKVKLIGLGASTQSCGYVKSGRWFGIVVTLPRTEGVLAGAALRAAVLDNKLPASRTPNPLARSKAGNVVTKKNVAKCPAEWTQ